MPSSEVMHKWKKRQLRSGGSGKIVPPGPEGQRQAVAIMLSEKQNETEHGGVYQSSTDRQNTPVRKARRRRK
jgi:hypothetical protein